MSSLTSLYPRFSKKNKNIIPDELTILLNHLDEAAFIVQTSNKIILAANTSAGLVVNRNPKELIGLNLEAVFLPEEGIKPPLERLMPTEAITSYFATILTADQKKVRAEVTIQPLRQNKKDGWTLVKILSAENFQQKRTDTQWLNSFWPALLELANASQRDNLESSLLAVLQAGLALFAGDFSAIYQVRGEQLFLEQIAAIGESENFPEAIYPADFMILKEPQLWQSKERTPTILHRAARLEGMQYLASAPLGQVNASIGIIVVGGKNSPPSYAINMIHFLASLATGILQNMAMIQSLQKELDVQNKSLIIANILKDQIKDSLLILTPDLKVLDINRTAEQSLGYVLKDVYMRRIDEVLICDRPILPDLETATVETALKSVDNLRIYRRNGDSFPANLQIIPIYDAGGMMGIAILFLDTSREESFRILSEQLEQRALLGEVTASFAHEVRNPINNISTTLQLLAMKLSPDSPYLDNVLRMQHECNRLNELIKSGLSFVKPMEYKMEALDIAQVIKNLLERWRGRFQQQSIQCQFQADPTLPFIEGDARAIEQVFSNLLNNSIQILGENNPSDNRLIGIKVQHAQSTNERSQVEVSISDNGPGIPDDIRDRIFEPFFTTRKGGTGIGLAIVKRIVTAHKGSIIVDSYPGATVFRILFPALHKKITHWL